VPEPQPLLPRRRAHAVNALLEEHDARVDGLLVSGGIEPTRVHAAIKRALGTGDGRSWEGILVTPRVRKIVEIADRLAGDRDIEPIDLFEAIRGRGRPGSPPTY